MLTVTSVVVPFLVMVAFAPPDDLLVTVNDAPIVEADVDFALRGGHHNEVHFDRREGVLDDIIRQELARQRAVALGLDSDPGFEKTLRSMETQLRAFKRKALSELYFRHETARRADGGDAEAKQYFRENAAMIRTESHVWQILQRSQERVEQSLSDIQHGASFEEVARRRFENLPEAAGSPWDLGYLKWTQVPKSWWGVVDNLKDGEVSGIIRGPNRRFWIIKLIGRRENPEVTFESVRSIIIRLLRNSKIEMLHEATERDMRAGARIVYAKKAIRRRRTGDAIHVPAAPPRSENRSE